MYINDHPDKTIAANRGRKSLNQTNKQIKTHCHLLRL